MRDWLIKSRGDRTQQSVADKCGISQNYYSMIENGERGVPVHTAKKIAKELGFDWVKFYENEEIANDKVV